MSVTVAIIVLAVLVLGLLALLAGTMAWPRNLRKHRPRDGRPAARVRRLQGRSRRAR